MTDVAIIGAGWLGSVVANELAAAGHSVVATTRSRERPATLAAAVAWSSLDLAAPQLDAIADARAWLVAVAPGPTQDRHHLYVDGARKLLAELPHTQVRRVVWIGSTSALPDRDDELDELEPAWPDAPRGRIQREAEQVVADACEHAGVPWLVLRMAGLYGPDRELERIYNKPRSEPLAGDGMTATNLVHRDDAVAAAIAALSSAAALQGVVHVVDDDHCPRRDMLAAAAVRVGATAPVWSEPPGDRVVGKRVRSTRLGPWLGVTLRHPLHGGDGRAGR